MSWRTVVIANRAKLELRLNYLICRGKEEKRIHLSEISTLIVESTAVSLTASLLSELIDRKIKVIFCDVKHNPQAELIPYYGCHDTSSKLQEQIAWEQNVKTSIATAIIYEKIRKQAQHLEYRQFPENKMLYNYLEGVQYGDASNREGHAAKVYFNTLFGMPFSRQEDMNINSGLNYGYAILLSSFNREIVNNGYATQLGIYHRGCDNQFNLACDLMEPYRILIDSIVFENMDKSFDSELKRLLLDVLNQKIWINGQEHFVNNGIRIYCRSIFDALNQKNSKKIKFYEKF